MKVIRFVTRRSCGHRVSLVKLLRWVRFLSVRLPILSKIILFSPHVLNNFAYFLQYQRPSVNSVINSTLTQRIFICNSDQGRSFEMNELQRTIPSKRAILFPAFLRSGSWVLLIFSIKTFKMFANNNIMRACRYLNSIKFQLFVTLTIIKLAYCDPYKLTFRTHHQLY